MESVIYFPNLMVRLSAKFSKFTIDRFYHPSGPEVKDIFVIEVMLKNRDFDNKNLILLAKNIPQRIIYLLRYGDEWRIAVFHTRLFISGWNDLSVRTRLIASLQGINLDLVWQNIVSAIGEFSVALENSLTEQIKVDEMKNRIIGRIEILERQMRSASQPHRQREIYAEIKKLKGGLNG